MNASNAELSSALMPITARPDAIMVRGEGSYLWDNYGNRYLDFIQGWAVNALGHCPVEIVTAINTQASQLITPSPALHNAPQHALATRLQELSGLSQVHFTNSGAEANEAAIKLARKWGQVNKGGAFEVISTDNGFHGRTLAMMAASGKPGWNKLFPPIMPGFRKVPYGDLTAMQEVISPHTVAIIVEPIQGEAGVIVPPDSYLSGLRQLANQHNLLLILDEIQTGVGRTGGFFAFEHHAIKPDILTLGKGLGGGVPIAAILAAEHVCCFEYGDQGGTYNGNPLMTAVGLAVIDTVSQENFLAAVNTSGHILQAALLKLGERFAFTDVRGQGLLWAVDLPKPRAADVQEKALELGLLINAPRPNTLRLMPALNVQASEIAEAIELLDAALVKLLA